MPVTTKPLFSLIVPAHNEAQTIVATLAALTAQDFSSPFEIIVACNGCTDNTEKIAHEFAANNPMAKVIASEKAGMSWGKNFGAQNSCGEILIFVDADTILPSKALSVITAAVENQGDFIGTMAGKPDQGGIVVKTCFMIANFFTKCKKVHAPGGVMIMPKSVWEKIGGFDEQLPQGTSSDLIMRARKVGAKYLYLSKVKAITSIRRFEKTGIIAQMLAWRKNHRDLQHGQRNAVSARQYDDIR